MLLVLHSVLRTKFEHYASVRLPKRGVSWGGLGNETLGAQRVSSNVLVGW